VVETRDAEHAGEMVRILKTHYDKISFTGHGGALGLDILSESEDESDDEFGRSGDSGVGYSKKGEETGFTGNKPPGLSVGNGRRGNRSSSARRLSINTTTHDN
jgi:hypothetical protein